MDLIIAFVISIVGANYCNIDIYSMFTFINLAVALYKRWIQLQMKLPNGR